MQLDLFNRDHCDSHHGGADVRMECPRLGPDASPGRDGAQGFNGCPDPLRSRFQLRQNVNSDIVLSHRAREVCISQTGVGHFCTRLCRLHRLFNRTLGAVHVSSIFSLVLCPC